MVSEEVVFVVVVVSDEVVDGGGVVDELSGVEDESDVEVLVEGVVSVLGEPVVVSGVVSVVVGDVVSVEVVVGVVDVVVFVFAAIPSCTIVPLSNDQWNVTLNALGFEPPGICPEKFPHVRSPCESLSTAELLLVNMFAGELSSSVEPPAALPGLSQSPWQVPG